MTRVLVDANVFLHALGNDEALRRACTEITDRLGDGELIGEASVLLVNEVVHVRNRRLGDRRQAVNNGLNAARLLTLHAIDERDVLAALELFMTHSRLDMSDAIQAAVARRQGLRVVLSTDRGFDDVPGLRRVDPADSAAVASVLAG